MRWIALLLIVFSPVFALAEAPDRQIMVSATGVAQAPPDMATIRLGVSREARTASRAMADVAEATADVLEEVAAAGIEPRDVQTSSLSLNPVWDQSNARPRQIRGYAATSMLTIRVRALDNLGTLLDAVVGQGANTLGGLSFSVADPQPLQTEARADAVRRARAKAETLAEAGGVSLGQVVRIQETNIGGGPIAMARGAMLESAAVPIAAGELDMRVSVTVTFGIGD